MIQSSLKSTLLRVFRPQSRAIMMTAAKLVHHQLNSNVGLFESLVRGSGGGWPHSGRSRGSSILRVDSSAGEVNAQPARASEKACRSQCARVSRVTTSSCEGTRPGFVDVIRLALLTRPPWLRAWLYVQVLLLTYTAGRMLYTRENSTYKEAIDIKVKGQRRSLAKSWFHSDNEASRPATNAHFIQIE